MYKIDELTPANQSIMKRNTISTAIILVILISSVLNLINFKLGHNWGGDFTWYIAQAKAIVDGNYDLLQEFSHFRQNYSTKIVGPGVYPWGYPALLAPIYYFFGSSLTAFKFFTYLFLVGSLVVIYRLFANKLPNAYLFLVIALLAFNPNFAFYKENISSDFPAMFFALVSILIVQDIHKLTIGRYILLSLTAFMAFWIRTQYIVLLPSLLLYILFVKIKDSRIKKKAIPLKDYLKLSVILITFGALFLVDRMTFVAYSSYSDHLTDKNFFLVVKKNIEYYPRILAHFWGMKHLHWPFDFISFRINYFLGILTAPLLIFGIARRWKIDLLYLFACLSTLFLLLIYPGRQGIRFIFLLLPFYAYFTIKGLEEIKTLHILPLHIKKLITLPFNIILWILAILFIFNLMMPFINNDNGNNNVINGPYTEENSKMFEYIKLNTPANATFAFFKPRILTFLTERKCISVRRVDDLRELNIDYLVLHKNGRQLNLKQQDVANAIGTPVYVDSVSIMYKLNVSDSDESLPIAGAPSEVMLDRNEPDNATRKPKIQ